MSFTRIAPVLVSALLIHSTAFAQAEIAPRNAVSFSGGGGFSDTRSGLALGGSWLFDMNERASLEAQGTYLDRGPGADALSISGSLLLNLLPSRQRAVPYAAIGGGVHRTSFDLSHPAMLGPSQAQFGPGSIVCPAPGTGIGPGPGAGFGPGMVTCPANVAGYWGVGQMPAFYARRLGAMSVPQSEDWGMRSFVDPATSIGGGLRFNVNEHVMLRPDARALVIFGAGDTHTLAVFGINVGYRF